MGLSTVPDRTTNSATLNQTWAFSSTIMIDVLLSWQLLGGGVGGGCGVGVEMEEWCLPSLGEDILISSLSRRMMVVFFAFLSPSSLYFSVSTSISNWNKQSNKIIAYTTETIQYTYKLHLNTLNGQTTHSIHTSNIGVGAWVYFRGSRHLLLHSYTAPSP